MGGEAVEEMEREISGLEEELSGADAPKAGVWL